MENTPIQLTTHTHTTLYTISGFNTEELVIACENISHVT